MNELREQIEDKGLLTIERGKETVEIDLDDLLAIRNAINEHLLKVKRK